MGHAESAPDTIGCITLDVKQTGKPGAGNRRAGFDEAGAGNVTKGAGLRANTTRKWLELPPDPTVGAPVLYPTDERGEETWLW